VGEDLPMATDRSSRCERLLAARLPQVSLSLWVLNWSGRGCVAGRRLSGRTP